MKPTSQKPSKRWARSWRVAGFFGALTSLLFLTGQQSTQSLINKSTSRLNALLSATDQNCSPNNAPCDLRAGTTIGGVAPGGGGEANTGSNLGGGLANYSTKVGVDLRFNSFDGADFDLNTNLFTIDGTKWLTIVAAAAAYQPLDADLTSVAALATTTGGRSILASTPADDHVYVGDSASAGTWRAIPNCPLLKLVYTAASNEFGCIADDDEPDATDFGNLSTSGLIHSPTVGTVSTRVNTATIIGRVTAGLGVMEELTLDNTLAFNGSVIERAALTDDVTSAQGSNSTVVANVPAAATVAIDASEVTSGTLAGARGGVGIALPTCVGTDKLTANGTQVSCATDQTGGGAGNSVEVELDFTASGEDVASVVVTGQAWVTSSSEIVCTPTMMSTADRAEGAEDAVIEGIVVAPHTRVASTGFTVTGAPRFGQAYGRFKIHCIGV